MGSVSLTAVNAFGDPRAARVASARFADRGYPVVAAARLGDIAVRNGLLAIIGAAYDHERMIAISTRMHDRVAALAVVGGPPAILLGQHEGLTMPTLVVSDRVGRRDRRRIVRRLPRGSMLVRAVDFDAALDAVVTFLDLTAEGRRQPIRSGTLRPIALRLAPAAFLAPAAAVVLGGSAEASAVCEGVEAGGLLTITCDGDGADLTLTATNDDLILLDGNAIAKLSDIQKISILTTGGDDKLTIDQLVDKLRSGPEGVSIAFDVDGGGGLDELKLITGLPAVQLTAGKISLIDDTRLLGEIKYAGFDAFSYLGDETASKMEINGLNFAKLDLNGGGGEDSLKLISGDSLIKITEEALSLNFSNIEIDYKEYKEVAVVGDEFASKMEIADFAGHIKLDVDGGGGGDELSLIRGLPAVQLTADKLLLADFDLKLSGEIKYAGFDTFSYLGDETASKMEINGLNFSKLELVGGGGGDSLKLTSGDGLIGITEEAISLNFSKIEIDYEEFSELKLVGGELDSKVEINGFHFDKFDFDGGGGLDELKLTTGLPAVQLTADKISLLDTELKLIGEIKYAGFDTFSYLGDETASKMEINGFSFAKLDLDGGGGPDDIKLSTGEPFLEITEKAISRDGLVDLITHKDFESLSVLAATDIANKFDGSEVETLKLTLDGGSNDDILLGGKNDDLLTGGLGNNKISGGGGIDTVAEAVDGNFVASNSTLTGAGLDALSSIEALKLTGGAGDNSFNTEPFKGKVTLDGGAGNDRMISGPGADLLIGGTGIDSLNGGQGNDTLLAGEGDDTLNGGPGTDVGDGGPGVDTGKSIEDARNIER